MRVDGKTAENDVIFLCIVYLIDGHDILFKIYEKEVNYGWKSDENYNSNYNLEVG